jgi:hypothetical protein
LIIGKNEHFKILERGNEMQGFYLEIRQIGKLQDRRVFYVESFDVKIILSLK